MTDADTDRIIAAITDDRWVPEARTAWFGDGTAAAKIVQTLTNRCI
ncbi:hypothetical protein [Chloroflexus aggregans]|nr:hypothetical protein [Chloroflexus aggregans]